MTELRTLRAAGIELLERALPELSPREVKLEVDLLLGSVLGLSRERVYLNREESVAQASVQACLAAFERRCLREPVAYITGEQEFYGQTFKVGPAVLIPRPETELLVEEASKLCKRLNAPVTVVDVGVGSGAVLVSLWLDPTVLAHGVRLVGIDKSEDALAICSANVQRLAVGDGIKPALLCGDLLTAVHFHPEATVLVVSNPPYIPDDELLMEDVERFEPVMALRSGADGLTCIRELLAQSAAIAAGVRTLALVFELGRGQDTAVESIARRHGFSDISFRRDLQGVNRVCIIG